MKVGLQYERTNPPLHRIQRHFLVATRDKHPGVSFIPSFGSGVPSSFSDYANDPAPFCPPYLNRCDRIDRLTSRRTARYFLVCITIWSLLLWFGSLWNGYRECNHARSPTIRPSFSFGIRRAGIAGSWRCP